MNTSTTHHAPQLALTALSEAATPGEWEAIGDCVRTSLHMADQTGGDLLVTASPWMEGENIQFIAALVNWFRSQDWNTRPQSRPEAELPELPEPDGFIKRPSAENSHNRSEPYYFASKLRAYGKQCAASRLPIEPRGAVADDFDTASHVLEEYADLQDMAARNDGQFPISINGAWASESLRALAKRLRGDL